MSEVKAAVDEGRVLCRCGTAFIFSMVATGCVQMIEAFGCGTAAIVCPIKTIDYQGEVRVGGSCSGTCFS